MDVYVHCSGGSRFQTSLSSIYLPRICLSPAYLSLDYLSVSLYISLYTRNVDSQVVLTLSAVYVQ